MLESEDDGHNSKIWSTTSTKSASTEMSNTLTEKYFFYKYDLPTRKSSLDQPLSGEVSTTQLSTQAV